MHGDIVFYVLVKGILVLTSLFVHGSVIYYFVLGSFVVFGLWFSFRYF